VTDASLRIFGVETRPADLARQTQHVSIDGSYRSRRDGKDGALPRAGRQLESIESAMASRSPSSPVSLLRSSTCCHVKRNRMKSAGVTGSISARSLFSV
jgi:hypothetical protein